MNRTLRYSTARGVVDANEARFSKVPQFRLTYMYLRYVDETLSYMRRRNLTKRVNLRGLKRGPCSLTYALREVTGKKNYDFCADCNKATKVSTPVGVGEVFRDPRDLVCLMVTLEHVVPSEASYYLDRVRKMLEFSKMAFGESFKEHILDKIEEDPSVRARCLLTVGVKDVESRDNGLS